ncbi:hypothetical protein GDO78_022849 [Eleutherodactylus coqui]|uniref:CCHC-type domain-containing protein n=1 Tax=Eleutherodactylus coqui TaxID=57060 RepID=A0A8J6E502_ELECQ|nr:hypothetical protein GDO78_022849 [Eleutherodactylus coqui]
MGCRNPIETAPPPNNTQNNPPPSYVQKGRSQHRPFAGDQCGMCRKHGHWSRDCPLTSSAHTGREGGRGNAQNGHYQRRAHGRGIQARPQPPSCVAPIVLRYADNAE